MSQLLLQIQEQVLNRLEEGAILCILDEVDTETLRSVDHLTGLVDACVVREQDHPFASIPRVALDSGEDTLDEALEEDVVDRPLNDLHAFDLALRHSTEQAHRVRRLRWLRVKPVLKDHLLRPRVDFLIKLQRRRWAG